MSASMVEKIYNMYASFYDKLFGKILNPGRQRSIDFINNTAPQNAKILEVGVGTGLSLPLYRSDLTIHGIDISQKMLEKAEKRIHPGKVHANVFLKRMNAENLQYADNSFDIVIALYVASVVSDIDKFLNEICRVCKPNGEIIFVNHFASDNRTLQFIEKQIGHIHSWVGFKSDFSINAITHFSKLNVLDCHKTNLFGYWKILRCKLSESVQI